MQDKVFCHYSTCYLLCRSSLSTRCLAHASRNILWDKNWNIFPHPWKVTTPIFKVVSHASGLNLTHYEEITVLKAFWGFVRILEHILKGQISNNTHKTKHGFRHLSFYRVQIQWVNLQPVRHLDSSELTFFHLKLFFLFSFKTSLHWYSQIYLKDTQKMIAQKPHTSHLG